MQFWSVQWCNCAFISEVAVPPEKCKCTFIHLINQLCLDSWVWRFLNNQDEIPGQLSHFQKESWDMFPSWKVFSSPRHVEVNNTWYFMLVGLNIYLKAVNFQQCCALVFVIGWAELAGKNSCIPVLVKSIFLTESLELLSRLELPGH